VPSSFPYVNGNLDQGSMTVYKGDEKMGVMVAEGLSSPLCWAVSMFDTDDCTHTRIKCEVRRLCCSVGWVMSQKLYVNRPVVNIASTV
jgi:hypothetical protein